MAFSIAAAAEFRNSPVEISTDSTEASHRPRNRQRGQVINHPVVIFPVFRCNPVVLLRRIGHGAPGCCVRAATDEYRLRFAVCQVLEPGFYISFHNRVFRVPEVRKNRRRRTFEGKKTP